MKTLEQLKDYKSNTLTGRDITRLVNYLPESMLPHFGVELKEEYVGKHEPLPLTRENVLKNLESDLEFAFEKALDQRGISAGEMHSVIMMWNWILEDGLENVDTYAQYGLPLLKMTAVKYGFSNPIGDDVGDEDKYAG